MLNKQSAFRTIRETAEAVLERRVDPLIAARTIDVEATSIGLGLEPPFIGLKGIVSQADDLPDPSQASLWNPEAFAEKQLERSEFLKLFGDEIVAICWEIQAYIASNSR